MKCEKCQKETFLPFKCQYCRNYFCPEHRLPENHDCPQIENTRALRDKSSSTHIERSRMHEYTVAHAPNTLKKTKMHFSSKEISHLFAATLLVAGVGLSYTGLPAIMSGHNDINFVVLILFVAIFTTSFLAHEIAHKMFAQRIGCWAEFRLTTLGATLTLLSVLPTIFKIISPGAVMIGGFTDKRNIGRISIAGPLTNIVLSTAFLTIASFALRNALAMAAFATGAAFNAWIALFNLIPFGTFDGLKVFVWDKRIWALAFTVSLALTVACYGLPFSTQT